MARSSTMQNDVSHQSLDVSRRVDMLTGADNVKESLLFIYAKKLHVRLAPANATDVEPEQGHNEPAGCAVLTSRK